jgi:CRISPR-associated protein Csb2
VQVVRFAVASQAPHSLLQVLTFTDALHRKLCGLSGGSAVFTGQDEDRQPLQGHQHSYLIAQSLGRRGAITHLSLVARGGFPQTDQEVLASLRQLQPGKQGERHPVQLTLLDMDSLENHQSQPCTPGTILGTSTRWVSVTPFLNTRRPKFTRAGAPKKDDLGWQKGSPQAEICRQLRNQGLPAPFRIQELPEADLSGRPTPWHQFQGHRPGHKGGQHFGPPRGFVLEFSQPVSGPLSLGQHAHFGMGLFRPL